MISALCEDAAHDGEEADEPVVALQGLAVATCVTVKKCLNDNDKVHARSRTLSCSHRASMCSAA